MPFVNDKHTDEWTSVKCLAIESLAAAISRQNEKPGSLAKIETN